ncbi:cupin domain-containing protein [Streptomyces noursei]|uniref:cupin domain-containing protein n=1 Tax=Streptomyces noursei TaxID=1971 RepID=UPI0035DF683A
MIDAASWAARLGGETFLAQTLFRSHTIIKGNADAFAGLLSWDDLNALIASRRLEPPRLRLSRDGVEVPLHRYTLPVTTRRAVSWRRLEPAAFHECLADGSSLVLDSVDDMHDPLRQAAEGLERFTGTTVQVNVYASWTAQEGFGIHWDDHDVVVLQLYGAKRWRLYGPTRQAPAWRDTEVSPEPEGDPLADEVLTAGDMLYLPRGWWHSVSADQGTPSLHLTFGLGTQTGADFLNWAVDQLRSNLALRLDVPRFAPAEEQAAYVATLRTELAGLLDDPQIIDRWATSVDTTHPGRLRPSLPYVTDLPPNPAICVRLTCSRAHLSHNGDVVTLSAAGTAWDFAAPAHPILSALLPGHPVTLAELAERASLPLTDVATLMSILVQGQAATVVEVAL